MVQGKRPKEAYSFHYGARWNRRRCPSRLKNYLESSTTKEKNTRSSTMNHEDESCMTLRSPQKNTKRGGISPPFRLRKVSWVPHPAETSNPTPDSVTCVTSASFIPQNHHTGLKYSTQNTTKPKALTPQSKRLQFCTTSSRCKASNTNISHFVHTCMMTLSHTTRHHKEIFVHVQTNKQTHNEKRQTREQNQKHKTYNSL